MTINGQGREVEPGTLQEFLDQARIDSRAIAVERNGEIVPRRLYGEIRLESGDRLEVVRMTGGG